MSISRELQYHKGAVFPPEIEESIDAKTGVRVRRLTSHPSINHATYFLQSSFVPDGSAVVFVSYRSGAAQIFEAAWPGGEIRQLTADAPIHPFSPAISRDGERIVFVRSGGIWELERSSLDERLIVSFPSGQLGEVSLTAGGEWITAAIKKDGQPGIVAGKSDGSGWTLIPFPRTIIHPQFHPLEPEWIEFSGDPAPRMHRVRRDGTGLECLYEHSNDEFVVHETFLGSTGDLVYTVWPFALRRMNWQTREHSTICEFNAWHITPNRSGSAVLCDTNHPDTGICLIDAMSGERLPVCESLSSNEGTQWKTSRYALAEDFARAQSEAKTGALSWMEASTDRVYGPQWTHPHPSFSNDETKVTFASNRSGQPQVYVAEIPQPLADRFASR